MIMINTGHWLNFPCCFQTMVNLTLTRHSGQKLVFAVHTKLNMDLTAQPPLMQVMQIMIYRECI